MAKTRTVEWEWEVIDGKAEITIETLYDIPPGPGPSTRWMDMGLPELTASIAGFSVRCYIDWSTGSGGPEAELLFKTRAVLSMPFGFSLVSGSASQVSADTSVTSDGDYELDWEGGTIRVTMEVEEEAVDIYDGTWPSAFGTAILHGPPKRRRVFREKTVVGSTIDIEINLGGISHTWQANVTDSPGTGNWFYLGNLALSITERLQSYRAGTTTLAYAMPKEKTLSVECRYIPDGVGSEVPLTCTVSNPTEHGHSVGGSSSQAIAPAGVREGAIHRTRCITAISPLRIWKLYTYFRAMEDAYPTGVNIRVDRLAGSTNQLVGAVVDGTDSDEEEQEQYTFAGQYADRTYANGPFVGDMTFSSTAFYTGMTWDSGTGGLSQPTSASVDQWQDFQCGIDNAWLLANSEETLDWRLMPQIEVADSFGTLSHDSSYTVEDGTNAWSNVVNVPAPSNAGGYVVLAVSGGTGSASRSLAPTPAHEQPGKMDWQAAQQLEIVIQADASSKPFTIEVNGKEWSGDTSGTANSDTTITFDLRGPHDATADTDGTQSRWPIGTEGEYFGVNATASIAIKNLEDGVTYKINSITLKRQARSNVCFGMPTRPWIANGVGSNYLRHVHAESYKVALEIAGMYQTGMATPAYPTVQQFFDTIDIRPGWSYVDTATAEQLAKSLMWIGGLFGVLYDGSAWQSSIDLDATAGVSLWIVECADIIYWYPYMGIPGGTYQAETPMRVGKVLRGRIGAVVIDPATHEGAAAVDVTFSGGASPAETVATDAEGYARSEGRKWGSGNVAVGSKNVSMSQYNRWIAHSGFSEPGEEDEATSLSIDFSPAGRFVRAYVKEDTIRLAFASDANWLVFEEVDTTIEGTSPQVRWQRNALNGALYFTYMDRGGVLYLVYTTSEGAGTTLATSLATDATQHDLAIGENQVTYAYWLNAAGEIKGKMLNFAGDTIQPLPTETSLLAEGFETGIDGVDDTDIACAVYAGGDGQFYVVLDYYAGGALLQAVSTDGRSFS